MTKRAASRLAPDRSAHSLGRGLAGTALLHVVRAHVGQGSWATAHEHVAAMTSAPIEAHAASSLFSGVPAVAYVLHIADRTGYHKALSTLDQHIEHITLERLRHAHDRIDRGQLPSLREFDLISGLSGLGAYQLGRNGEGVLLEKILSYLARLCEPVRLSDRVLPGWWTSNDTADRLSDHLPGGHGNLGMAHGITGPLTLLATASLRGVQVPGQSDAIQTICTWLDQWRQGEGTNAWWPGIIKRSELDAAAVQQSGPQRPSWCYGTPGIARAQQLAGLALADQARQHSAETALLGCITDSRQLELLNDPSLCHGWAGLLQTARRAAADARPDSPLDRELRRLMSSRLDSLLWSEATLRNDGLLEGTVGVQLAQITAASIDESMPAWDSCLLLDG